MSAVDDRREHYGDRHQPGCDCDRCEDAVVAEFAARLGNDQPAPDPVLVSASAWSEIVARNPDLGAML